MAIVAPFRGFTYNFWKLGDLSRLVTPPYDVISNEEQNAYYQTHPYNTIRLILGKKKLGDSDWDNRYTRAANYFERWESEDILIRSERPSLYITSQTYDPGNGEGPKTRWGIIALVRIEEKDSDVILPHERTFSAHKDDRLRLMRACNAQFSPVFGIFEDPDNTVLESCHKSLDFPPQIAFESEDGLSYRMWILQRPDLFRKISQAMIRKPIFIADGHHRYETARNFRNMMRSRHGWRPANRSYEFVMMYLTNMNDEGLSILPSHRLVKNAPNFRLEPFLEEAGKWFYVSELPYRSPQVSEHSDSLRDLLRESGSNGTAIVFQHHDHGPCYIFSLKPGVKSKMGRDLHPSLKKLDVLVLSRFVLQRALGFTKKDLDNDEIFHYESSISKATSLVDSGDYKMAFLLNPTKIDQVREIAANRLIMPRKSTYFYPKIITGLVFNKINPYEVIPVP